MTADTGETRRIILAVTETSSLDRLWNVVVEHVAGARPKIITVFVSDDRWHRAASLPFTREISRVSGAGEDFTRQRAEQIGTETAGRARERISTLAAEAELDFVFEVLAEHETARVRQVVRVEQDLLIAPSALEDRPVFIELARLNRKILLVDIEE